MTKPYTVQVLLFGRDEVITYNGVERVEYGEYHVKIFSEDGVARIRESRIDVLEELNPE